MPKTRSGPHKVGPHFMFHPQHKQHARNDLHGEASLRGAICDKSMQPQRPTDQQGPWACLTPEWQNRIATSRESLQEVAPNIHTTASFESASRRGARDEEKRLEKRQDKKDQTTQKSAPSMLFFARLAPYLCNGNQKQVKKYSKHSTTTSRPEYCRAARLMSASLESFNPFWRGMCEDMAKRTEAC